MILEFLSNVNPIDSSSVGGTDDKDEVSDEDMVVLCLESCKGESVV